MARRPAVIPPDLIGVNIEDELREFERRLNCPTFRTPISAIPRHVRDDPHSRPAKVRAPRKPRKGDEYIPSPLRPTVLTSDRLLMWLTPHSYTFSECIAKALPASPLTRLFEVMAYSLDEGTRSGYGSGLLRFTQFCDAHGVEEKDRMPASELLLSAFAASGAGKVGVSAVNTWMAGLHFWHTINGATWNGRDMLLQTRQGIKKLVPISSKRAKRPPVTMDHLLTLRKGLDLTNSFDIAVWAVAAIAFWSCCRLGELTIPSMRAFDAQSSHYVTRNCPLSFSAIPNGTEFATLHIPYSKTTSTDGADISITARSSDATCPFMALRHHLRSNRVIAPDAPFFSFEAAEGGWSPMRKDWFLARCNKIWFLAGLPKMPGHSFRIGGATYLLLLGVSPDIVAVQGRWKSRAFLEYWRDIDSILPLFISSAASSSAAATQHAVIRDSMTAYKKKYGLK